MENHIFLLQIVLILFSARLFGEIASRLGAPAVIGELLAGIIIGPSLLNLVQATHPIQLLAQIGVILLLFEVGLETNVAKLASAGMKATLVATVGVILPFILGFALSHFFFNFSVLAALFIGATLTATSIGITLRVLSDLKRQNSEEGQIILGAAVIDDVIGIVLLSLLYEFSQSGSVAWVNAGKVMIFISLFFLLAPIAAKLASTTIKKWDNATETPGLLPTMIVSLILFSAWAAYKLGAPELLGGFAAGLALSRQFFMPFGAFLQGNDQFSHKIEEQMKPIVHLFTPIFFVAIGLSLNLKEIDWGSSYIWLLTGTLLVAAIIGKFLSGFVLFKENSAMKWAIGLSMIPRGEVGLIFAEVGLKADILDQPMYAALVLVIAITTLLAPFALRAHYNSPQTPRPGLLP